MIKAQDEVTSVTILKTWWQYAVKDLPDADRLEWYDAAFAFAFTGKVSATPIGRMAVAMVSGMLGSKGTSAADRGRAGGLKSGESRRLKAKQAKQNEANEAETKQGEAGEPNKEINKEVSKEESESVTPAHVPTFEVVKSHVAVHFCPVPPDEFVRDWYQRMGEGGWKDSRGGDLTVRGRWQRELSAWWRVEREKKSAARADSGMPLNAQGLPMGTAATHPEDYEV